MEFFGKNLKSKHKVTLCLVLLGILADCILWSILEQKMPWVEFVPEQGLNFNSTYLVLAFGILVKCLVIDIFRKF